MKFEISDYVEMIHDVSETFSMEVVAAAIKNHKTLTFDEFIHGCSDDTNITLNEKIVSCIKKFYPDVYALLPEIIPTGYKGMLILCDVSNLCGVVWDS